MKNRDSFAEKWNALATAHQLSLHACLDETGKVAAVLFPNATLSTSTSARDFSDLCFKTFSLPGVAAFLSSAEALPSPGSLRVTSRGIGKHIPLPAPRAMQLGLAKVYDVETGRWTWSNAASKRILRAVENDIRCEFTAPSFFFALPEDAALFLTTLSRAAPDTMTDSALSLAAILGDVWSEVERAKEGQSWVLVSAREHAIFGHYTEASAAVWTANSTSRWKSLFRESEEEYALLCARCLSIDANERSFPPEPSVQQSSFSESLSFAFLDLRFKMPFLYPHVPSKSLAALHERLHQHALQWSAWSDAFAFAFGSLSPLVGVRREFLVPRDPKAARAWQAVLAFLGSFAEQLDPPSTKASQVQPFSVASKLLALDTRQNESVLPQVASWQMPAEVVPQFPVLVDNGTHTSLALLHPTASFGTPAERRKATACVGRKGLFTTQRAFELDSEGFEEECRSDSGRILPSAPEQIVGGFLTAYQYTANCFGTLGFATTGKVLREALGLLEEWPMRPHAFLFTDPHRVFGLEGVPRFAPRVPGYPPGVWIDIRLWPASGSAFPVVVDLPQRQADVALVLRPKSTSSHFLNSLLESHDAVRSLFSKLTQAHSELSLLSEIEFEPVFRFQVDNKFIMEQDWLKAKKSGKMFLLPGGETLDASTYDRCLEVYLLRKKSLARFGKIGLADVWKASRVERGGSQEERLTPEQYLRMLVVKVEGLEELFGDSFVERFVPENSSTLRPYQQWGVGWILSRFALGLGACLADDMGLGKTFQTIFTLRSLLSASSGDCRCLIVCPKTLVLNWMSEWQKFSPDTEVVLADGPGFDAGSLPSRCVVVTSLPRLRNDVEAFLACSWTCVVVDEAHQLKNPQTAQAKAVRRLNARHRLALTGTPLENHARELWSLADWLNEGWLGPCAAFDSYTRLARSKVEKELMLEPVRSLLQPVLLRRLKTDRSVSLDLPPKIESTLDIDLTPEQATLYETVVLAALGAGEGESNFARSSRFLKAILHCKQICAHPDLFLRGDESKDVLEESAEWVPALRRRIRSLLKKERESAQTRWDRSNKFLALREKLISMSEQGGGASGGVLVFTQSLSSGKMIQDMLQELDIPEWKEVPFLTGALSAVQRNTLVSDFQEACRLGMGESPPVLIISLKAGGLGLNLTGAAHVIHFDRWWNPAAEDQASDRAHRMGQQRTVQIHHFRTRGTIEAGIAKMLEGKRALAADLLGAAQGDAVGDLLKDERGFLSLVDPEGRFRTGRGTMV